MRNHQAASFCLDKGVAYLKRQKTRMPRGKTQIRRAPDRATTEVVGVNSWLRKIASARPTSSRGRRQNNDSPSIIILQLKPDESSTFMARLNRDDITPKQSENFRDMRMKLKYEAFRRNFSMRARPQALIVFFR